MARYGPEANEGGGKRQVGATVVFFLVAVVLVYLPDAQQQRVASGVRATLLLPFTFTQSALAEARRRSQRAAELRSQLDSAIAVVTSLTTLREENQRLRGLLELSRRVGISTVAASVIRPGTTGSESLLILDVGSRDGVTVDAPVFTNRGLVGKVREVRERSSVGIDWTHPDFAASAMTREGTTPGIVESRRRDFREADRLVLTATAYQTRLDEGTDIVTSGRGGLFPRGIPIGRIAGVAEEEEGWLRSYWVEPFVEPGSAVHVLVASVSAMGAAPTDLGGAWPADSMLTRGEALELTRLRVDSIPLLRDSIVRLRARLDTLLPEPAVADTLPLEGAPSDAGGGASPGGPRPPRP